MAVLKQLFQDRIDLISGNAPDRKHRDPVFFINAQNDVSAANIIDIIGERTNGTKDRRRVCEINYLFDLYIIDEPSTASFSTCPFRTSVSTAALIFAVIPL